LDFCCHYPAPIPFLERRACNERGPAPIPFRPAPHRGFWPIRTSVRKRRRGPEHSARYKRYIKSKEWARKRTEYFAAFGRACQACRSQDRVQVHHKSYANLENEPLEDLAGLCEGCHVLVHRLHDSIGGDLRIVTDQVIADYRAAGAGMIGSLAPAERRRPRQSKRKVRYNKRIVSACMANRDRCRNPAPSGSGYCWDHDPELGPERAEPNRAGPAKRDPLDFLAERIDTRRDPRWVNGL